MSRRCLCREWLLWFLVERLGELHFEDVVREDDLVEGLDGFLCFFLGLHDDEGRTLGTAGHVAGDADADDLSCPGKESPDLVVGCVAWHVTNVQLAGLGLSPCLCCFMPGSESLADSLNLPPSDDSNILPSSLIASAADVLSRNVR